MRRLAVVAFVVMSAGCTSLAVRQSAVPREPLSATELAIAEAALRAEIEGYRGQWPVVVLDETESWMPPPGEEPEPPAEVPEEEWLSQNPPVPAPLRAANAKSYVVGTGRVAGEASYSRARFERMERSRSGLRPLSRMFSGREPAVLEVSRPSVNPEGDAHILVHAYNTWNGCGGISMYRATKINGEWVAELQRVLVIW